MLKKLPGLKKNLVFNFKKTDSVLNLKFFLETSQCCNRRQSPINTAHLSNITVQQRLIKRHKSACQECVGQSKRARGSASNSDDAA